MNRQSQKRIIKRRKERLLKEGHKMRTEITTIDEIRGVISTKNTLKSEEVGKETKILYRKTRR